MRETTCSRLRLNAPAAATLSLLSSLCLGAVLPFAIATPAAAAERVTLTYGFAEISVSVEALRAYEERGEIDKELAPYIDFLSPEQRSQLRQTLQARQDVGPVKISQFLYSSIGQNILRYLGDIVQTQSRRDGAKGLRGALVLAAAEPGGLSLLGVLENFPTSNVRIDSQRVFQALNAFTGLIRDTDGAIAAITDQSRPSQFVTADALTLSERVQKGPYAVTQQNLMVEDRERDRVLPTDLYLPDKPAAALIVISHGLAGDRQGFAEMAEYLASHGYAVAALDHPGSNRDQLEALLRGSAQEIAKPTEFSDRPRDVSYLLDELTRLNAPNNPLANRLDMNTIGIIGHSFGGYTALALAGAQLDFDTLQTNCDSDEFIFNAANPSMLLQCTALLAPEQFSNNLQDERIKAVMAINPVTSSLFGPSGFSQIAIPSLLVAGSSDPIAPALLEQIQPFTWLNRSVSMETSSEAGSAGPDHFLALIQGGSHLYNLPELDNTDVSLVNELVSADIPLAYSYLKALSLGFMQAELDQDPFYQAALNDASIVQIGQSPLPLYIVNSLTEDMLKPAEALPVEEIPAEETPDI
ncbi:MAG: alpha/beta fold hydrolase [Phormidesmis sp.]